MFGAADGETPHGRTYRAHEGQTELALAVQPDQERDRAFARQLEAAAVDTAGLRLEASAVALRYSLDGGPFLPASWQASADGSGLELAGDRAVAFLIGLYGKSELRLALVRPLSVPFVLTFAVGGAEQGLGPLADRCQWSGGPAISDAGR